MGKMDVVPTKTEQVTKPDTKLTLCKGMFSQPHSIPSAITLSPVKVMTLSGNTPHKTKSSEASVSLNILM